MNGRNNEAMSTEDFLRELFKNADRGGETNYLQLMGTPVAAQATQGRSAGWNEADHPRDDVGQFTFKEGGGAGQEKRGRVLLASADGKSAPQGDAAQSTSQKRGGTLLSPGAEKGSLRAATSKKTFDTYVANYEKFRPAWDTMEQHTGVPTEIAAMFGLRESQMGMETTNPSSKAAGIMQVTPPARTEVAKMKLHDPVLRAWIEKTYGDASLYDGTMYMRFQADALGLNFQDPDRVKIASKLCLAYVFGQGGYRSLSRLAPGDSVSKGLSEKAIQANRDFLTEDGKIITRSRAEAKFAESVAQSRRHIGEIAGEAAGKAGRYRYPH